MVTFDPNNPGEALASLADPLAEIQKGLDNGLSLAEQVMDGWTPNAWLHATLVRYGAWVHLSAIDTESWYLRPKLPNAGIELICGSARLRVLKTQDGGPPHPGRNEARCDFWAQRQLQMYMAGKGIGPSDGFNFVVDWEVGDNQKILLALTKTIGEWSYKGQPKIRWRRHVVMQAGQGMIFVPAEEDITVEPMFDLTGLEEADEVG